MYESERQRAVAFESSSTFSSRPSGDAVPRLVHVALWSDRQAPTLAPCDLRALVDKADRSSSIGVVAGLVGQVRTRIEEGPVWALPRFRVELVSSSFRHFLAGKNYRLMVRITHGRLARAGAVRSPCLIVRSGVSRSSKLKQSRPRKAIGVDRRLRNHRSGIVVIDPGSRSPASPPGPAWSCVRCC